MGCIALCYNTKLTVNELPGGGGGGGECKCFFREFLSSDWAFCFFCLVAELRAPVN